MNNLLALSLTVVILWNIVMSYLLYKIKAFNNLSLRAHGLSTQGISELVRLMTETVSMVNEHTERIVEIETEVYESENV